MAQQSEIEAALDAFNHVRIRLGGIKTDDQQMLAMAAALEAAEKHRRVIDGLEKS